MKRTVVAAGALALLPAVSWAVAPPPPGAGFFSLFYSYLQTRDSFDGGSLRPSGSGGGGALNLALPLGFFAQGEYAYNYQHDDNDGLGFDQQVRQGRIGGGYALYFPLTPVSLYADGEYIHYGLHLRTDTGIRSAATDEDGGGFHGGVRFTVPGVNLYAAAGYVDLSHSDGPEFEAGFRALVGPFVYVFGQYRYTHLRFDANSDFAQSADARRFSFNDIRVGLGIPFGLPMMRW